MSKAKGLGYGSCEAEPGNSARKERIRCDMQGHASELHQAHPEVYESPQQPQTNQVDTIKLYYHIIYIADIVNFIFWFFSLNLTSIFLPNRMIFHGSLKLDNMIITIFLNTLTAKRINCSVVL